MIAPEAIESRRQPTCEDVFAHIAEQERTLDYLATERTALQGIALADLRLCLAHQQDRTLGNLAAICAGYLWSYEINDTLTATPRRRTRLTTDVVALLFMCAALGLMVVALACLVVLK